MVIVKSEYKKSSPVLVLPDVEPLDQILGALQFRMQTVLLALEASHVLHCHAEGETKTHNSITGLNRSRKEGGNSVNILFIKKKKIIKS